MIGVTGSTGKTSTKDILAALLRPQLRTHASRENLNTEIGLPLTILEAPRGTEALVLEMAMRGEGQIAELVAIAEPDVGVIVNVGPVHLELLGTVESVAAAKAELIRDLRPAPPASCPAGEPLLDAAPARATSTRSPSGRAATCSCWPSTRRHAPTIDARGERSSSTLPYDEPHNLLEHARRGGRRDARSGVRPAGSVDVRFSSLRGEVVELRRRRDGRQRLLQRQPDVHARRPRPPRRSARRAPHRGARRRWPSSGPTAERFHREIGAHAAALGIDVLVHRRRGRAAVRGGLRRRDATPVATPEEAGALLEEIARPGDRVLVKGSRSVGPRARPRPETRRCSARSSSGAWPRC